MNRTRRTVALLGLIIATTLIAGCFGGAVEGVRVAEVTKGDVSKVVSAVGTLDAATPTDVKPSSEAPSSRCP